MGKLSLKQVLQYLLIILLLLVLFGAYQLGFLDYLGFDYLKSNLGRIQSLYSFYPWETILIYFFIYVIASALSFPGATVLTLFGGAVFGNLYGVIIVAFASTIGATFSFWITRFLLKDFVGNKFKTQLDSINKNIEKDGAFYLFSLRVIPMFPFFVVNMVMGLTSISTLNYFVISFLGMIPAIIVYVYAGNKFGELTSISGILNFKILFAFLMLGTLPYFAKSFISILNNYRLYKKYKKPRSFDFNMIVIGGGAAGLVTSYISAALKSKVAIVEKYKMGGDCLNFGCVPSKALIKSSKVLHMAKNAKQLGLKNIQVDFDFSDVMSRVKRIKTTIEPHDSIQRYTELGVECLTGEAKILTPFSVSVEGKTYTTQNITIATGSKPFIPKILGLEKASYVTSETIWDLKILPKKFLIIGGGAIGCEFAQAFARFGSEVLVIEQSERLLIREDLEVSSLIRNVLSNEQVKVFTGHAALEFLESKNKKYLKCQNGDETINIEYDLALIAIGRKPNITGYGLEELGVSIRANGSIETDEFMRTTFPNIYACGDVSGPYQLTHTAAHQAWYCAINGLFGKFKKFKVDYSVVPWCTFTDPEVATVGLNEEAVKEKKISYEVTLFQLAELDRAIADDENLGFVKIITKKGSDKILGATIVGAQASNMILEFVSVMKFKKGLNHILDTIHIYPSLGEANKYAAGVWKKAHAPKNILVFLEKYFKWTRS